MIPTHSPAVTAVLFVGFALSVLLPAAVVAVAVRGYRRTDGDATALRLAVGIVLVTAVPTLMRLGLGAAVSGGAWPALVVRLTELLGLLVVLGVMHGE